MLITIEHGNIQLLLLPIISLVALKRQSDSLYYLIAPMQPDTFCTYDGDLTVDGGSKH